MNANSDNSRRNFINSLALGATGAGLAMMAGPLMAKEALMVKKEALLSAESWFENIKGTHRMVFDGTTPHESLPVAWTYVFYATNNATEVPNEDMTAVLVLRHSAIPFAMRDDMWDKYKFGEFFGIKDNLSGEPALRNTVYEPKDGDFVVPGIEGIKQLQERGAMFCVCDLALKVYSGFAAEKLGMEAEVVYEDWKNAVLPGIEIMPSGVWALGRAQEHGCGYIFAGN